MSSKLDLRNSREREGELQSEMQFPAFARERLDPGFNPYSILLGCCAESYILQ